MNRRQWLSIAAGMLLLAVTVRRWPEAPDAVSGTVTLGGKPVPLGEIVFEPDSSQRHQRAR